MGFFLQAVAGFVMHGRMADPRESWLRGQKGAPAHHELFGIAAQTKAITNLAT
jgi:hypothetical protein